MMKSIINWTMGLAALGMAACFTACSSDEEPALTQPQAGKVSVTVNSGADTRITYTKEDGTGYVGKWDSDDYLNMLFYYQTFRKETFTLESGANSATGTFSRESSLMTNVEGAFDLAVVHKGGPADHFGETTYSVDLSFNNSYDLTDGDILFAKSRVKVTDGKIVPQNGGSLTLKSITYKLRIPKGFKLISNSVVIQNGFFTLSGNGVSNRWYYNISSGGDSWINGDIKKIVTLNWSEGTLASDCYIVFGYDGDPAGKELTLSLASSDGKYTAGKWTLTLPSDFSTDNVYTLTSTTLPAHDWVIVPD